MDVAVVSACLPTLRPLLQAIWPSALAKRLYGSGSNFKGANVNSKDTHFKMSPRRQHREEFQWLAEDTGNTMTTGSRTDLEADREVHYENVYSKGNI